MNIPFCNKISYLTRTLALGISKILVNPKNFSLSEYFIYFYVSLKENTFALCSFESLLLILIKSSTIELWYYFVGKG